MTSVSGLKCDKDTDASSSEARAVVLSTVLVVSCVVVVVSIVNVIDTHYGLWRRYAIRSNLVEWVNRNKESS